MVDAVASGKDPSRRDSHSWRNTGTGPGRTYSGFHPLHTTSCQMVSPRAMAASLGQVAAQARLSHSARAGRSASSRASRPASSRARPVESVPVGGGPGSGDVVVCMAAHLLPEPGGDVAGQRGHLG